MMSWLGLGKPCQVTVDFDENEKRKKINVLRETGTETLLLFNSKDPVSGEVTIRTPPGKKLEHQGIKLEMVGQIEVDRGNTTDFTSTTLELEHGGVLSEPKTYEFDFSHVDKPHESYSGINVRLRYFIRTTIIRQYAPNVVEEQDFWVHKLETAEPEINNSIKMEVGIEDMLHIEFEYNRSRYHLKDVVIGKIFFLLVRIKIKHMELAIIKRESTGSGPNLVNESETITKFEIMDGAPVRGESIPIRLYLSGFDLTPTFKNIHSKYSVKYYLNLVLVDEEDRRYFKQQEIVLWRKR